MCIFNKNFYYFLVFMSMECERLSVYTIIQEVRKMDKKYLCSSIKELLDECNDIELLYLIQSLLGGN